MENSPVNGLIYQAVYIAIFIVATSVTVYMFQNITNYSENVSDNIRLEKISELVSENEEIEVNKNMEYVITGAELFNLVNNYGLNGGPSKKYNKDILDYTVYVLDENDNKIKDIKNISLVSNYELKSITQNKEITYKKLAN